MSCVSNSPQTQCAGSRSIDCLGERKGRERRAGESQASSGALLPSSLHSVRQKSATCGMGNNRTISGGNKGDLQRSPSKNVPLSLTPSVHLDDSLLL